MNYKITRDSSYQADERSKEEDIQHFKYVSKEKVNGKWRYYYWHKTGSHSAAMFEKTKGSPKSEYGTYVHNSGGSKYTVVKGKSDKLLSANFTLGNSRRRVTYDIDGLIEQAAKKTVKNIRKTVNKGMNFLRKLFG